MQGELRSLLWAKTDQIKGGVHPLLYHLIDVGCCALHLWQTGLQERSRELVSESLSLDQESAGRLLAFWAALHDLGKASPVFQQKHKPAVQEQEAKGILYPAVLGKDVPHGIISAWAIEQLLPIHTNTPKAIARRIGLVVGGHHGSWPTPGNLSARNLRKGVVGEDVWGEMRSSIVTDLVNLFRPPAIEDFPDEVETENSLLTFLSGFTSVSDWLGSNKIFFPCMSEPMLAADYYAKSENQAKQALTHLGWGRWHPEGKTIPFDVMFPGFTPRQNQSDCINQIVSMEPPAMLILEAPTGIGKTEVALFAAGSWLEQTQGSGIYVAMPTMATSNEMYKRFRGFLSNMYPDQEPDAVLAHSQARFVKRHLELAMTEVPGEKDNRIDALAWFQSNKKQALLHPFGVGTVDQGLISVLQTKHFFVRLFGLAGKVVIFDEVHAYDTYMSIIFYRLLAWLRALNVSVVVLSATLPKKTREEMLSAYTGLEHVSVTDVSYPRLTIAHKEECKAIPLPPPAERTLKVEWLQKRPEEIARMLKDSLEQGGCAAVICNTVRHAQEIYLHLQQSGIIEPDELLLFHARFPMAWRQEIEQAVVEKFGTKRDKRPKRFVLVATQVVEQSLDLDFDLIISDLAPIDLLLQRAGRLHRHRENAVNRPPGLQQPRLVVLRPDEKDGLPDFGSSSRVYEEYVLLQTLLALKGKQKLQVMGETEALIEKVYGDSPIEDHPLAHVLSRKREKMLAQIGEDSWKARKQIVPKPDSDDLLFETYQSLEEDNPEIHRAFRAMTRLIDPGVSLICLHEKDGKLFLQPEAFDIVDVEQNPTPDSVFHIMQHVVEVRDRRVFRQLLEEEAFQLPAKWREVAAFRYHRLAIFRVGKCEVADTNFVLHLDRELGLSVQEGVHELQL